MRRLLVTSVAALLSGLLVLAWGWRLWTGPGPDSGTAPQLVRVPPGMTLAAAAETLAARGLLDDARVLRAGARLTGRGRDLRAGLYRVAPGLAPRALLQMLTSGSTVQVRITVPEGLSATEIGGVVAAEMELDAARFLAVADSLAREAVTAGGLLGSASTPAAHDELLAREASARGHEFHWCEGYMAPDTYLFAEGTAPEIVATTLVETQLARLDTVLAGTRAMATADLSPHQLLTLASIVEAEARLVAEQPLIAAVYVNRMVRGWRLEADPTVAFVLSKKGKRLFYRDLEVSSAFNTYRTPGLPPGPIGAPGPAALAAAARPDPACDALYFVSDGDRGHVFSRTAREHEAAVSRFREIRSEARRR